ncbi:rab-GTPase-TBC domain-containing protein [Spinellus fusiger]|nr:rab-GTPase-TBC domain-containing protein [Spinellus fusiger]
MLNSSDETEFADIDIHTDMNSIDLNHASPSHSFSAITLPPRQTHSPSTAKDPTHLDADRMLDELSATTDHDPAIPLSLRSPSTPATDDTKQASCYDQFFEEVSLDLPRETQLQPSSSKLLKFIPRRTGTQERLGRPGMTMTASDVAGPFYSISDVLDDTLGSHSTKTESPMHIDPGQAQRGARRNVYEGEVVVTSGGTSGQGLQRRTSLSMFGRNKGLPIKPSPLESVVSKTRPRMLPPKDRQEERKHLQEHEAMMKKARKLEAKKQKENNRRKEEKDKQTSHAVHVWETDIFPQWSTKIKDKKTHELWIKGVPPRCRRRVWLMAIDNKLDLTKDTFVHSLQRLPVQSRQQQKKKKCQQEMPALSRKRIASASYDSLFSHKRDDSPADMYRLGRRRTSSLNVLHESELSRDLQRKSLESHSSQTSQTESTEEKSEEECGRQAIDLSTASSVYPYLDSDSDLPSNEEDSDTSSRAEGTNRGRRGLEREDLEALEEEELHEEEEEEEEESRPVSYLNKTIDEDILRTLPSLCVFQPRGASFLAGMLLLNMGAHDSFVSLANLIHKSDLLSALYSSDEQRVKGYFKIFNVIFAENLYKLYLHFQNLCLTPDNYLPDWFMTLFASIVPLELSSRLWDIFLLQGDVVLFKAGLTVLKYLEPLLWGGSFGETVKVLNMGFVGEERGKQVKAALAVSGHITEGEQDLFFDEVLGKHGIHLDTLRYNELVKTHIVPRTL